MKIYIIIFLLLLLGCKDKSVSKINKNLVWSKKIIGNYSIQIPDIYSIKHSREDSSVGYIFYKNNIITYVFGYLKPDFSVNPYKKFLQIDTSGRFKKILQFSNFGNDSELILAAWDTTDNIIDPPLFKTENYYSVNLFIKRYDSDQRENIFKIIKSIDIFHHKNEVRRYHIDTALKNDKINYFPTVASLPKDDLCPLIMRVCNSNSQKDP